MNPNRLIPVLQDGATIVWESNTIVRYLAAHYGAGGLWPEDPSHRSEADRWMDWQLTTLQPAIGPIFLGPDSHTTREARHGVDHRERGAAGQAMTILDAHLANRPYVAGDG